MIITSEPLVPIRQKSHFMRDFTMQYLGCRKNGEQTAKLCPKCGLNNTIAIQTFGIPIGPGLSVIIAGFGICYFLL